MKLSECKDCKHFTEKYSEKLRRDVKYCEKYKAVIYLIPNCIGKEVIDANR